MAYISKGITLGYKETSSATSYTNLTNLQEIPDLGGEAEAIETTVLSDAAHTYTNGILNYGDSLSFKFLHDPTQFATLAGFGDDVVYWQVGIPDGASGAVDTTCSFTGTCSVKFDGVGVNSALTYTLNIKPNSTMAWA